MRIAITAFTFALALAAAPAFAQNAAPADTTTATAEFSTLRDTMTTKNKDLTVQLNTQREIVKKNMDLLKEAQRLDAANKKIQAEQEKLAGQNADLIKQREALGAAAQPVPASTAAADKKTTNVASR